MKRLLMKNTEKQSQYLLNDYSYTNYGRCNLYENNVHRAYLILISY